MLSNHWEPCGHSLSWVVESADSTWNGRWSIWWADGGAGPVSGPCPSGPECWRHWPLGLLSLHALTQHYVIMPALPEASVCALKGTLKFSCIGHVFICFWWPSSTTLTLFSGWKYRSNTVAVLWQCFHSEEMSHNTSLYNHFLTFQINTCIYRP